MQFISQLISPRLISTGFDFLNLRHSSHCLLDNEWILINVDHDLPCNSKNEMAEKFSKPSFYIKLAYFLK